MKNQQLIDEGYVSLERFLSAKECKDIENQFLALLKSVDISKTADYPHLKVANHTKNREVQGNLGRLSKPVLLIRGLNGFDDNMIELFNAEKLIKLPVDKIKESVKSAGFGNYKLSFSLYYNESISNTRGYHRDASPLPNPQDPRSVKQLYKFFMYITDVLSLDQGPYSYIPRTHTWSLSKKFANHINGVYDDPNEFDLALNPKIFLEKAGMALISDQAGFHRGFPQKEGATRIMLVCKMRKDNG